MTLKTDGYKTPSEYTPHGLDSDAQPLFDGTTAGQINFPREGLRLDIGQDGGVKIVHNGEEHEYSYLADELYPGQSVPFEVFHAAAKDADYWAFISFISRLDTETALAESTIAAISPIGYARLHHLLTAGMTAERNADNDVGYSFDRLFQDSSVEESDREAVDRFLRKVKGDTSTEVLGLLLGLNSSLLDKGEFAIDYDDYAKTILTELSLFQVFDDQDSLRMIGVLEEILDLSIDESSKEKLWQAVWGGLFDCGAAINILANASNYPSEVRELLMDVPRKLYPEIFVLFESGNVGELEAEVISIALNSVPGLLAKFDNKYSSDPRIRSLYRLEDINSAFESVLEFSRAHPEQRFISRYAFQYVFAQSIQASRESYPSERFLDDKRRFYTQFNAGNTMNETVPTTDSEVDIARAYSLIEAQYKELGRPLTVLMGGIGNGQRFEGPIVERCDSAGMLSDVYAVDLLDQSAQFPDNLRGRVDFRVASFSEFDPRLEGKVDLIIVPWSGLNDMPKHEMIESVRNWSKMLSENGQIVIDSPLIDGRNSYDSLILSQQQMWSVPGMMRRAFGAGDGEVESDFTMNEVEELLYMFELLEFESVNVDGEALALLGSDVDTKLAADMEDRRHLDAVRNPFYAARSNGKIHNRMTVAFRKVAESGNGVEDMASTRLVSLLLGVK